MLAIARLATFVHGRAYEDLPADVRSRLQLMLTDLLGVTVAGMRTPELRALIAGWQCPPGKVPVPGSTVRTAPDTAAYLSAIAACALELDEGNKYAAGHPAAHVVFAATAAARQAGRPVPGHELLSAVALGYEVAARFGRATRRDPRWHTHGHWGATGAACAAGLLLGCSARQLAAAIDAATGLMHIAPWHAVLSGDFTRNLWIAGANEAGLRAARLALAGLVENRGSVASSLGDLVGTLDTGALVDDLGDRWLVAEGYLKRHSSCSYTHAAVDLVQSLRAAGGWGADNVLAVRVRIHSLAAALFGRHPANRLAAMFSLPFVVSTAVVSDRVDPATMEPCTPAFEEAEQFSDRVHVEVDERLDEYLPKLRCTEVDVELRDGTSVSLAQGNPIGDADHFPLGTAEVSDKQVSLIGAADAARVQAVTARLPTSASAVPVLDELP
ncbi:MmgE/PrpD family protein [Qaidamihabitans albus]|uniref:MmgE/PrpD family protein n=1 Tax=Qaidamihabitans albus TaxID=2795733 RepID=UPI0018F1763F|nr:MmgE/PrpD family protein [Qaidamihabitans albus]